MYVGITSNLIRRLQHLPRNACHFPQQEDILMRFFNEEEGEMTSMKFFFLVSAINNCKNTMYFFQYLCWEKMPIDFSTSKL